MLQYTRKYTGKGNQYNDINHYNKTIEDAR